MSSDELPDEVARRAAELLEGSVPFDIDLPPAYVTRLVHQLQVHQIELEMQNDELQRAWAAEEEAAAGRNELFELAPLPYLVVGADGSVTDANRAAVRLLGDNRQALIGHGIAEFVAPSDRPQLQRALATAASGNEVDRFDVSISTGGHPRALVCITASADGSTLRVMLVDR